MEAKRPVLMLIARARDVRRRYPSPRSGEWSATVTDDQRDQEHRGEIADTSDDLLEQLTILKALEVEKRDDPMSSPRFHELATEITEVSREIFSLARHEERAGDALSEPQGVSIEEEEHPGAVADAP